jgi:hypothetical protein
MTMAGTVLRLWISGLAIGFWSQLAFSAEDRTREQCSEMAHRIACHAVSDCSGKQRESDAIFEKRHQLELMVLHLCERGPKGFSEYWWIDVSGGYRPYYLDKSGNKLKFPPQ